MTSGWANPVPGKHRPSTLLQGPALAAELIANEARWQQLEAERLEAERLAEQGKAGTAEHRRRERRRRAEIVGPYTRREVFERDGGRCYMCDRRLPPDWHVEHVIPIARGGADTFDNVRAACPRCNLRKGTQEPCYRRTY